MQRHNGTRASAGLTTLPTRARTFCHPELLWRHPPDNGGERLLQQATKLELTLAGFAPVWLAQPVLADRLQLHEEFVVQVHELLDRLWARGVLRGLGHAWTVRRLL